MNVVVLIPFRDNPADPCRASNFAKVSEWAGSLGVPVVVGDSDPERSFNVSQARNRAAYAARSWDIAVMVDADTLCDPEVLEDMVGTADRTGRLVLPGRLWQQLPSGEVYPAMEVPDGLWGGLLAVPRAVFDTVRGFDERFSFWGSEVESFVAACDTLTGRAVRGGGRYYHLWHEAPSGDWAPSGADPRRITPLALRYWQALFRPDAMAALVREPGHGGGPGLSAGPRSVPARTLDDAGSVPPTGAGVGPNVDTPGTARQRPASPAA